MLRTVNEREFFELLVSKELFHEMRVAFALPAYQALHGQWESLDAVAIRILGYLIGRTLGDGRLAQRVPITEFMEGTSLSRSTIRRHLADLCDANFLHIYTTASDDGHEKEARMFEIDCKKLLKKDVPDLNMEVLSAGNGGSQRHPPGSERTPPSYINTIDTVKKNTCIKTSARSSRSAGKETNVFAMPKKPKTVMQRSDSALDVLAQVQGKARAVAASRVEAGGKKAPHQIERLEMQAIIDKAMKTYHPNGARVIVTGKEYGMLKKRLREAPPTDFQKFINLVIGQWFTIATQNGVAQRKKIGTGAPVKGSAMPMAPDFAALAYRYPYFLKVFANNDANAAALATEKPKEDRTVAILREKLQEAERDKAVLRGELVKVKNRVVRRSQPVTGPASKARPVVDFNDDFELPTWEQHQRNEAMKNVR